MTPEQLPLLTIAILVVAVLSSSVGHGSVRLHRGHVALQPRADRHQAHRFEHTTIQRLLAIVLLLASMQVIFTR